MQNRHYITCSMNCYETITNGRCKLVHKILGVENESLNKRAFSEFVYLKFKVALFSLTSQMRNRLPG